MPAPYVYPIYRANETQLRIQIMEILNSIDFRLNHGVVGSEIGPGETVLVGDGQQLIVYWEFLVDTGGTLVLDGDLVVLGGAYRDENTQSPYRLVATQGNYALNGGDTTMTVAGP